jgi:hypothetical protein
MAAWEETRNFSACITGILVLDDADKKIKLRGTKNVKKRWE